MATQVILKYTIENIYQPQPFVLNKLKNTYDTGIIDKPQISKQLDPNMFTFVDSSASEIDTTHIEAKITLQMTSDFLSSFTTDAQRDKAISKSLKSYIQQSLPVYSVKEEVEYI